MHNKNSTLGKFTTQQAGWSYCTTGRKTLFALYKLFGSNRTRTDNFMLAKHTLYQLSYTPFIKLVIFFFNLVERKIKFKVLIV